LKGAGLRIAVLETGRPPEPLEPRFGRYPAMFEGLLGVGAGRAFRSYDVTEGDYPAPGEADALLVTGSPAGAYDPLPWIEPLKAFLRASRGLPMVGVCFGHQIMAEALGGHVEKYAGGWAVGLYRYHVVERQPWMDGAADFAIPASHQDQVVVQPPGTRVIARCDFTPFAALAYQGFPAISFQGHPEFDPSFAAALIEARRGVRFDEAFADAAVRSLGEPNDNRRVGAWIDRFLELNSK
jgi:GMP synthase-like glutamine amidotransferase